MYDQKAKPFYMMHPMNDCVEDEKRIEEEHRRMVSYLTPKAQLLQKEIEELLDTMEYDGSPMYDEHPDKEWLYMVSRKSGAYKKMDSDLPSDVSSEIWQETVYMLVLWEVFRRRAKRRRSDLLV